MYIYGKFFKKYDDMYYVSADGDVYSKYIHRLLKHYIDRDGYHRVDIHGKHIKVHKLVYEVWKGKVPKGRQINHKDDNKDHNTYRNLYLGTQRKNIEDCIINDTRVGHIVAVTIYDKEVDKTITFPSVKDFIVYSDHTNKSGSLSKLINKKWFKARYKLICKEGVETIESYKSIRAQYNERG